MSELPKKRTTKLLRDRCASIMETEIRKRRLVGDETFYEMCQAAAAKVLRHIKKSEKSNV